jgi:PAS domain S-box-containing protein
MDTDRNLLFGVLALQADLIDATQFIEACLLWTTRKTEPLADLLVERGSIEAADKVHIEYLLERKLRKYGGNMHASLAAIPDDIKRSLATLGDDDIERSLAEGPFTTEPRCTTTIDHVASPAERYCRLRLHATGGIGRVWVAHDDHLGRDVALKELRPERAELATLRERFLREAQITGQLEHPGIIPVYELARARNGGQPFYTMRFVKGRTLSEAARAYHDRRLAGQANALELPGLLNAFVTVCNTVAYAHSRGVIHRDLKGQNVILGDFGEVVVLDWGLAKLVGRPEAEAPSVVLDGVSGDSGYTVQGQVLGTPAYMAPEQADGRLDQIDRRTDVYGLGAILYEILTGAPPFTGQSTEEVLCKVREDEPAPPRQRWPEVPPALDALCLRALAKRPEDRPAAAAELAQEVQGWQEFERRKAEEALRESEALYQSLVETLPQGIWRKDLAGRFIFANGRFCESLGRSLDQVIGKTDFDFFPRELAEKYQQDDRRVHETATPYATSEDHLTTRGEKLFVDVVKSPIFDATGKVIGTQGIFWDVTERKLSEEQLSKAQEALRESEALYHSLVETLPCNVWRKDLEGRFTFANQRFCEHLGLSLDQLLGKTNFDLPQPALAEKYRRNDQKVLVTGGVVEDIEEVFSAQHQGKRYVHTLKIVVRDGEGKVTGTQGIAWDVTERKLAEEELRKSRERFELAVLASQDGFSDWDVEAHQVWYSPQMRSMLGYSEEEMPNRPGETEKRVHPDDHARWRALLRGQVTGATDHLEMEFRMLHKDGSYRWVRDRMVALRRADGKAYRIVESREDITKRKEAEEELACERDLLAALMDNLPDGIYFKDAAGRFLRVNRAVADYFGVCDPTDVMGKTDRDFFTEEYARATAAAEQAILQTGQPFLGAEEKVTFGDGRVEWVSTTKLPFRDKDGNIIGTFGVSRNISERKRAEDLATCLQQRAVEQAAAKPQRD